MTVRSRVVEMLATSTLAIALAVVPLGTARGADLQSASPAHVLGVAGDFNGDGFPDLVIGNGGISGSEQSDTPGYVRVVPGTAAGPPDDSEAVVLDPASVGLPVPSSNQAFGSSVAVADFNHDGYADLAIGSPGAPTRESGPVAGAVVLVYGGPAGLHAADAPILTEATAGVPGRATDFDDFGAALAAPDLNGDGFADLVVGMPGHSASHVGALVVLRGTSHGISVKNSQLITRGQTDLRGNHGHPWATRLATGDFNHDGHGDIAIGIPRTDVSGTHNVGRVDILYGAKSGLRTTGGQTFTPTTPGVGGSADRERHFGATMTRGDFNADGYADLAIAAPGRDGAVTVLYGSRHGLQARGSQFFTETTPGVPGTNPSSPHVVQAFGQGLATLQHNPRATGVHHYATLYIGVPADIPHPSSPSIAGRTQGTLIVLHGSTHGLTTKHVHVLPDPTYQQIGNSGWGASLGGGPAIIVSHGGTTGSGALGEVHILNDNGPDTYNSSVITRARGVALAW